MRKFERFAAVALIGFSTAACARTVEHGAAPLSQPVTNQLQPAQAPAQAPALAQGPFNAQAAPQEPAKPCDPKPSLSLWPPVTISWTLCPG